VEVEGFPEVPTCIHERIQFTGKPEKDGYLYFLETDVDQNPDGSLDLQITRNTRAVTSVATTNAIIDPTNRLLFLH
jgi:hypothetical protein